MKPRKNESQESFMRRCVPAMLNEGRPHDQAVAMCISMWENKK